MQEIIAKYCRELRLGQGFVENYPTIEADTHEQFLLKLLQMEVERRAIHRKNRLLKQAGFPVIKTFAGLRFKFRIAWRWNHLKPGLLLETEKT